MTIQNMTRQDLPSINALWIGEKLNAISTACLISFIKHGHQVNLYTYGEISNLPTGVHVLDGSTILDKSKIIKHQKSGSFALFSDIFRYALLSKIKNGIYVDCDVYCLKPLTIPEHGYLLGYENDSHINGAVLALPADSSMLNTLINLSNQPYFTPEWYSSYDKMRLRIKRLFGYANTLSTMGWGVIGPSAITHYAKKLNITNLVQPVDVLYPVQHHEVNKLLDPSLSIHDVTTLRSVCAHLYNETLKNIDLKQINPNCILAKMLYNEI
ncbi:glycosyltransferase [Moraxella cuniculi]|uniref:Mannosyltransferase OCH1 and related enzymes n=1 Tax=Moraxella cuniculi TaxID=34061 RepID=A0A3S4UUF7_9GAMM|nr:glycosyltransferase [Moraxella cuniculi]VEG13284.1 Mannosyltransferase OCH1 and related enzymes [Moraxella cuniculi]